MHDDVFDRVAAEYEALHNRSLPPGVHSDEFVQQKAAAVLQWIGEGLRRGAEFTFLDFGCGNGRLLVSLAALEPLRPLVAKGRLRLFGFDTSVESIKQANLIAGEVPVQLTSDMGNLPGGLRFDLITCCNVFHHIQPIERPAAARMLRSRIKPGARLAIWEHNPLNPLTRVLVRLCPFDEHASLLSLTAARRIFEASAFRLARYAYVNFFPPGWQRLKWVSRLEKKLFRAPMGAQYWALFERDERGLDRLESI